MSERLITVKEAQRALGGISHQKIYQLIGSKELRTVKLGRRRMVPSEAIPEYIKSLEDRAENQGSTCQRD